MAARTPNWWLFSILKIGKSHHLHWNNSALPMVRFVRQFQRAQYQKSTHLPSAFHEPVAQHLATVQVHATELV